MKKKAKKRVKHARATPTACCHAVHFAPPQVRRAILAFAGQRVLITTHSLADTDAIAACLSLAEFLGPKAIVTLPDRANSESRRLFTGQLSSIRPFDEARRQFPHAPIILLDCNDKSLLPQMKGGRQADLLIDHHATAIGSVRGRVEWVEPEAASCSELIARVISRPTPQTARFLVLGILSDSAHLLRGDEKTFAVLADLLQSADSTYEEMLNSLRQPANLQSRAAVLEGLRQTVWKIEGEWLLAAAIVSSHESHVADALVAAGADVAFAGTADKKGARISARLRPSLAAEVDLPELMLEVGEYLGGMGGGHPAAAGAGGPKWERLGEALILAQRKISKMRE